MPRPPEYEFTAETKLEALRRSSLKNKERLFCCEQCGKTKKQVGYLEIHHKLGIAVARRFYPQISAAVISSLANAEVLCPKCHDRRDVEDRKRHKFFAQALLGFAQL